MATKTIPITNNDEGNRLLVESPLALLVGMLLDQQVRETSLVARAERIQLRVDDP